MPLQEALMISMPRRHYMRYGASCFVDFFSDAALAMLLIATRFSITDADAALRCCYAYKIAMIAASSADFTARCC